MDSLCIKKFTLLTVQKMKFAKNTMVSIFNIANGAPTLVPIGAPTLVPIGAPTLVPMVHPL